MELNSNLLICARKLGKVYGHVFHDGKRVLKSSEQGNDNDLFEKTDYKHSL
jgi:hypothetical protein